MLQHAQPKPPSPLTLWFPGTVRERKGQSALDEILLRENYRQQHEDEIAMASKIIPQVELRKRAFSQSAEGCVAALTKFSDRNLFSHSIPTDKAGSLALNLELQSAALHVLSDPRCLLRNTFRLPPTLPHALQLFDSERASGGTSSVQGAFPSHVRLLHLVWCEILPVHHLTTAAFVAAHHLNGTDPDMGQTHLARAASVPVPRLAAAPRRAGSYGSARLQGAAVTMLNGIGGAHHAAPAPRSGPQADSAPFKRAVSGAAEQQRRWRALADMATRSPPTPQFDFGELASHTSVQFVRAFLLFKAGRSRDLTAARELLWDASVSPTLQPTCEALRALCSFLLVRENLEMLGAQELTELTTALGNAIEAARRPQGWELVETPLLIELHAALALAFATGGWRVLRGNKEDIEARERQGSEQCARALALYEGLTGLIKFPSRLLLAACNANAMRQPNKARIRQNTFVCGRIREGWYPWGGPVPQVEEALKHIEEGFGSPQTQLFPYESSAVIGQPEQTDNVQGGPGEALGVGLVARHLKDGVERLEYLDFLRSMCCQVCGAARCHPCHPQRCRVAYYCSAECKNFDSSCGAHKLVCGYKKLAERQPAGQVQVQGRGKGPELPLPAGGPGPAQSPGLPHHDAAPSKPAAPESPPPPSQRAPSLLESLTRSMRPQNIDSQALNLVSLRPGAGGAQ